MSLEVLFIVQFLYRLLSPTNTVPDPKLLTFLTSINGLMKSRISSVVWIGSNIESSFYAENHKVWKKGGSNGCEWTVHRMINWLIHLPYHLSIKASSFRKSPQKQRNTACSPSFWKVNHGLAETSTWCTAMYWLVLQHFYTTAFSASKRYHCRNIIVSSKFNVWHIRNEGISR